MIVRFFCAALLAAGPAAAFASSPPVAAQISGDLAAVQAHLRAIQTMTANFTQTDREGRVVTGALTLKRPGKIRFQYQAGYPVLIVADAGALTFIDYSVRQVQRWPIKSSPLGVLLDPERDLGKYATLLASADPRLLTVEVRDRHRPEYGRLTLAFARDAAGPAGLVLQGWVQLDSQNHRTVIRLTDQRFNVPVPDAAFAWDDPRKKRR